MTINALAADLVMDRTTLGRNILPLERAGLIAVEKEARDRRTKPLRLACRRRLGDGSTLKENSSWPLRPNAPPTCAPSFSSPPQPTSAPPFPAARAQSAVMKDRPKGEIVSKVQVS